MKIMTDNTVEYKEEKNLRLTPQAQEPMLQETNLSQTEEPKETEVEQTEEPQGSSMVSLLLESWKNTQSFIEERTGRKMAYPNLESVISSFIEWLATCATSATWIKPCWSRCYIHLPLAVSLKDETQRNSKESWMLLSLIKRSADTRNQSEWLVRIVVSNCLTSDQEKSLMTKMKSIMTSGLRAFSLCYIPTIPETYMRGRLPKWMTN